MLRNLHTKPHVLSSHLRRLGRPLGLAPRTPRHLGRVLVLPIVLLLAGAGGAAAQRGEQPAGKKAPTNTSPPSISGTPVEGGTLTADPGVWSGPGITLSYEWLRCDSGGGVCAPVSDANQKSYGLVAADVGATMRVAVTGTNRNASTTAVSAATAVVAPAPSAAPASAPPDSSFALYVSSSSSRSSPAPLGGATLAGSAYVFTREDSSTTKPVRFFLDEEPDSSPYQAENNAPYDFAGGSTTNANPWDTTGVADGTHRIVAVDGAGRRAEAVFQVDNPDAAAAAAPEPAFALYVSSSSSRSPSAALEGQTLAGTVYVFTSSDSSTSPPVRFFLDEEPDSTPYQVENKAPYDFAGGSTTSANPWDTNLVLDGTHRIVAVDAAGRRAEAAFQVDNPDPAQPPPTDPKVLYRLDWENGGSLPTDWGYQCAGSDDWYATRGTATVVTSPVDKGKYSGRVDLPADTVKPTACEALHGRRLDHGVHDYYSLAVGFPSGWREPAKAHWGMAIFQPNYQGIKGPAVGLFAHSNYVNLVMESGYCTDYRVVSNPACQYQSGNGAAPGNGVGTHYAIPSGRFATDVWHQLIMHVYWRADSQGYVEVFHRRKGETAWTKTAEIKGYPTLQWRDGYDPTSDKGTTDKVGAYRGQADYPINVFHDSWCRATTFASAENCF